MSYKDDFLMQWKEFSSTIGYVIIRQVKDKKVVSLQDLNNALSLEIGKWMNSSQYQGIWLNKLKKDNPSIGSKFEQQLKIITFQKVTAPPNSPILPYAISTAAVGVVSYALTSFLKLAVWQIWGATIIAPMFIGGSLISLWNNNNQKRKLHSHDLYMQQLEKYKAVLVKLCEEADSK